MSLEHREGRRVRACWDGTELFSYTYVPPEAQLESPRPYFHPVRTLQGDLVSLYRPHDHVWHKGIAWSLPNVGPENFWGGPTYRRRDGYVQLDNNGAMRHESFDLAAIRADTARVDERLSWTTAGDQTWFTERRRVGAAAWPDAAAWTLAFETTMRNVSGHPVRIGSPTTEGRENAGYGGLFWRGPRSFTNGRVITPDGDSREGREFMGWRGPWLAFAGRHDGNGRASTVVFRDSPANFSFPSQWFVRSSRYACLCPAPFFSEEYEMTSGSSLTLRYDVIIADGDLDASACGRLAGRAAAHDLLAPEVVTT
jgi:hypothetical protein